MCIVKLILLILPGRAFILMMELIKEEFRFIGRSQQVYLYTLKNNKGTRVKISNYGGIITQIFTSDKYGKFENICLGFDNLKDYLSDEYNRAMPYFGAIIGRYANRIANGLFSIEGKTFHLPKNNFNNTLHGGIKGFDKKIWNVKSARDDHSIKLVLSHISPDGEEGFPGKLETEVVYELNENNELVINYHAVTDQTTHINLTNHTYFNLCACKNDILDHYIQIDAEQYTEVDDQCIPTGRFINVDGTNMDFRKLRQIRPGIDNNRGSGYDHNFVLNSFNGQNRRVAEAYHRDSGRRLEVFSSEPGLQLYTANALDGSLENKGIRFNKYTGFCFETQHFPDSPNQPGFPSTLLCPGEIYKSTTIYKFSLID